METKTNHIYDFCYTRWVEIEYYIFREILTNYEIEFENLKMINWWKQRPIIYMIFVTQIQAERDNVRNINKTVVVVAPLTYSLRVARLPMIALGWNNISSLHSFDQIWLITLKEKKERIWVFVSSTLGGIVIHKVEGFLFRNTVHMWHLSKRMVKSRLCSNIIRPPCSWTSLRRTYWRVQAALAWR